MILLQRTPLLALSDHLGSQPSSAPGNRAINPSGCASTGVGCSTSGEKKRAY